MTSDELNEFAVRYAKAWCSHNPESVAAFFAEDALLTMNHGPPTPALEIARGFMRDFPDMIVTFDKVRPRADDREGQGTVRCRFYGVPFLFAKCIHQVASGFAHKHGRRASWKSVLDGARLFIQRSFADTWKTI